MNIMSDSDGGLRCLFVDMNSFFASCEQQENPELRGQPVAVAPVMADSTCAIAASYEAKAFGIKTGTPIREAKAKCPGLKIVHARPKLYVEYHHKILKAVDSCLPVEAVVSIDEVACRLDTRQRQPRYAYELALAVKAAIRAQAGASLTCSVGIAANRLLGKLASDMQKPDGLVMLRQQDLPQAILHLAPRDISGIGPNMARRLSRAGIDDMAALWAADGHHLRRIWNGIGGLRFHALLHGADLTAPVNPKRTIGHQHVLAPDQRSKEKAAPVIRQLAVRAAQRLRDEGFYCRRLSIDIKWMGPHGSYGDERSFNETQDTRFLLQVVEPLWNAAPDLKPLRIGVRLYGLTPQTAHQPDLFDKPPPAASLNSAGLSRAVDKLNGKFGKGAVGFGTAMAPMTSKIAFTRVPDLKEF